jgi:hypothetical protein
MTWSGSIYNLFSGQPKSDNEKIATNDSSCVNNTSSSNIQNSLSGKDDRSELFSGSNITRIQEQDKALQDLSRSVQQLQDISISIGHSLQNQSEITDRLDEKIARTQDSTLAVSLRACQLTIRANNPMEILLGEYLFIDSKGRYLSMQDDYSITLQDRIDRSTVFLVFGKGCICGLRNMKTLRYIGVSFWGTIQGTSHTFGKSEEMYFPLDGSKSGLLLLNCNWGGGGWLKKDVSGTSAPPTLSYVTKSITDRDDMIVFYAKKISGTDIINKLK